MNNKVFLKKNIISCSILFVIFLISLSFVNYKYYSEYTKNYNEKISQIIYVLKDNYKDITDEEIAQILNNESSIYDLSKYGIDVTEESIVIKNDRMIIKMIITNIIIILSFISLLIFIWLRYSKKKNQKIIELEKMIEEISRGNYEIDLDNKSEDELSILRDDLFKITLKLKEESNNSLKDKMSLKESLENISHQLKTPLTAMSISIDNILDSNDISHDKKREFLLDIKREINNINFLVKNLLQLSRFEVNVIKFNRKENDILEIVEEALKRVELLRDLRNVKIDLQGDSEKIVCDYNWEVEALSNIIKNAIEHSINGKNVIISISRYKTYLSVKITNFGTMDDNDLEKIFKRFYSGKKSIGDSIGIGLSLAKEIVEKDNGKIFVDSKDNLTTFEIKYY